MSRAHSHNDHGHKHDGQQLQQGHIVMGGLRLPTILPGRGAGPSRLCWVFSILFPQNPKAPNNKEMFIFCNFSVKFIFVEMLLVD